MIEKIEDYATKGMHELSKFTLNLVVSIQEESRIDELAATQQDKAVRGMNEYGHDELATDEKGKDVRGMNVYEKDEA